jgi:hypothetical protein
MKTFIALLTVGTVGTFVVLNSATQVNSSKEATPRSIKYEEVNGSILANIKTTLNEQKKHFVAKPIVQTTNVEGKTGFEEGMTKLFTFLKSSQMLYRYELNNSLKNYLDQMESIQGNQIAAFNARLNEVLDFHKNTISRLSFSDSVKANAHQLIENLKNPLSVKAVASSPVEVINNAPFIKKLENYLQDITTSKEIYLHAPEAVVPRLPILPVVALWTVLSAISYMLNRKKTVITAGAEEIINPTFKRIMSDLDYPLVMVDQGLNIIWQNKQSEAAQMETSVLQDIFKVDSSTEGEIKMDGRYYSVSVSELAYKSGKKNFLAQLKPKLTSNKHLEHLIDFGDVTSLIEAHNEDMAFGDVNQSVAQLAVKLGYLFKVSGKFLDLNFNKNISDCFIESDRLEGMMKEFIMGCHHIIKDESEVPGIYLRTNETANKFVVSCFLMNFRSDALESHPLTRDYLRRFSILEAKYSICGPAIEFRYKETSDFRGLDITLSFENRSELESIINNVSANA